MCVILVLKLIIIMLYGISIYKRYTRYSVVEASICWVCVAFNTADIDNNAMFRQYTFIHVNCKSIVYLSAYQLSVCYECFFCSCSRIIQEVILGTVILILCHLRFLNTGSIGIPIRSLLQGIQTSKQGVARLKILWYFSSVRMPRCHV